MFSKGVTLWPLYFKTSPWLQSEGIIGEDKNRAGRPFRCFPEVQERGSSDWDKEKSYESQNTCTWEV